MKVLKWIGIIAISIAVLMFVSFKVLIYNTKKASPERKAADSPRYSLMKKAPTMLVRPETPAARYTSKGGR